MRVESHRLDFLELLLCMAASHIIIGNPFFGAAVFLFADIVKSYFLCNLSRLRHANGSPQVSKFVLFIVVLVGMSVAFLYPDLMGKPHANFVSLFAICLVLRDYVYASSVHSNDKKDFWFYLLQIISQIGFDIFCILLLTNRTQSAIFGLMASAIVASGIFRVCFPEKGIPDDSRYFESRFEKADSYKIFSNMNLYATIAMNLGVMMYFCYALLPIHAEFDLHTYGNMAGWLLAVESILALSAFVIRKRWKGLALAEFTIGAVTWALGVIFMFLADTILGRTIWTVVWGMGITLISTAIRKFHTDFEAVGQITDEHFSSEDLDISNTITNTVATIISSVTMLLVMAVWIFIVPAIPDANLPGALRVIMLQLPMIFMLVAFYFALRQPLDYRNREKLMAFIEFHSKDEKMKEDLKKMLVRKYRMRSGVKILCTIARPFLRLRVSGIEHLQKESYPSVFVCNHGFIYGPVSAVIYLPTYFRPWIHNVMLQQESAFKEFSFATPWMKKVFGKKPGSWIIRQVTRGTCWALNSFNPIPVVRGASRDVMSTFNESLKALEDGDNILIFPERPNHRSSTGKLIADPDKLRNFYTGFAHVGKLYYENTGRELLFYPLFSDRDSRSFKIGKPVKYDPSLGSRESKKAVAEVLQKRMEDLAKN